MPGYTLRKAVRGLWPVPGVVAVGDDARLIETPSGYMIEIRKDHATDGGRWEGAKKRHQFIALANLVVSLTARLLELGGDPLSDPFTEFDENNQLIRRQHTLRERYESIPLPLRSKNTDLLIDAMESGDYDHLEPAALVDLVIKEPLAGAMESGMLIALVAALRETGPPSAPQGDSCCGGKEHSHRHPPRRSRDTEDDGTPF